MPSLRLRAKDGWGKRRKSFGEKLRIIASMCKRCLRQRSRKLRGLAKIWLLKNSNSTKSHNKNDKIIHCKISILGDVWNLERVGLKYGTRPVYNDKQERTGRRLPHRFPLLVRTSSLPMVPRKDGRDPCATKNQANDFCSNSRILHYVAFRQKKVLKDKAWSSSWDRTRL